MSTHRTLRIGVGLLLQAVALAAVPSSHADDFAVRCQTPGVIKCVGFDLASEIDPFIYSGTATPQIDTTVKASGAASIKFTIPPFSGANSSGGWVAPLGAAFGPNSTFYVQFRQRFSPEMVTTNFAPASGWKQSIFHNKRATCAAMEITTQNTFLRGYPQMYTHCGSRGFDVQLPDFDWLYQHSQGSFDTPPAPQGYHCRRSNTNPTDCSLYASNQWMTFYYEIKIGNWGQTNSSVKAWVAYEGGPLKQFVHAPSYRLDCDVCPADVFDYITLLPYHTNKSSSQNHPTAYVWYDELIVSRQPIPPPGNGTTDQLPPSIPASLSVR